MAREYSASWLALIRREVNRIKATSLRRKGGFRSGTGVSADAAPSEMLSPPGGRRPLPECRAHEPSPQSRKMGLRLGRRARIRGGAPTPRCGATDHSSQRNIDHPFLNLRHHQIAFDQANFGLRPLVSGRPLPALAAPRLGARQLRPTRDRARISSLHRSGRALGQTSRRPLRTARSRTRSRRRMRENEPARGGPDP